MAKIIVPLLFAEEGKEVYVYKINGEETIIRFLNSLGLTIGSPITLVSKTDGNLIVNIRGARVALGKSIVSKILINS